MAVDTAGAVRPDAVWGDAADLYDRAPIGYLILDLKSRIQKANPQAASILGFAQPAQLAGRLFGNLVCQCAAETWEEHRERLLLSRREPRGVDLTLKRIDGRMVTVRVECAPQPDRACCLMTVMDISRRVAELQESEARFRAMFEEAPDAGFLIGLDGRFIDGNRAGEELTGYAREELIGMNLYESGLLSETCVEMIESKMLKLDRGLRGEPVELKLVRRDGTEVEVEVACISIQLQGERVLLGRAHDLTVRKQAEKLLFESEQKYRGLFDAESDAIMIFDARNRRFVDVNEAALRLYGYSREEFLALSHAAITAEPEFADVTIQKTLRKGHARPFPSRHRTKSGTVFPVEISGCAFEAQGRAVVCGVVRDITERNQQRTELDNYRRELRRLASELSLAGQRERQRISAELHDGVSQLLSSCCLRMDLLRGKELPQAVQDGLDKIGGIIAQALEQTRSLTFELSCPMLSELGLAAALEELCGNVSHEEALQVRFEGDMEKLPLPMDRKIVLYRAARELLTNVVRHSEADEARMELKHAGHRARIRVSDNGKGFDAAGAGKGFSPSGGFGLFNIMEYLRHSGGDMRIESVPAGGTEVIMEVPLEDDHE